MAEKTDVKVEETQEVEDRGDDFTPEVDAPQELGSEFDADTLREIAGVEEVEAVDKPGEADASGDDGAAGKGDKPDDADQATIPKARFDEVNTKAKAFEEENAALRKQLAEKEAGKTPETDDDADDDDPPAAAEGSVQALRIQLKEKRTAARDALLDGDNEAYDALIEEADNLVEQIVEQKAREVNTQTQTERELREAMTKVSTAAFKVYPFLDVKSEAVDHDAVAIVVARRNELIAGGMSQPEALQQAIDEKAPKFAKINGINVEGDGTETPEAKATREAREKAARSKAASASVTQPATPTGSERETTFKVDINKISDAEFEKLPASVKAKLRGDTHAA